MNGISVQARPSLSESVSVEPYGYERPEMLSPVQNYPSPPMTTVHHHEQHQAFKDSIQIPDTGSENVLDALLSLGREPVVASVRSPAVAVSGALRWQQEPASHSSSVASTMFSNAEHVQITSQRSIAEKINLLRHYRYNIAPWV